MARARETITRALRMHARVIGLGQSPSSAQAAEGLVLLNDILNDLPGNGGALPFRDYRSDVSFSFDDCWPCWPSVRVTCTAAQTVTLPMGCARNPVPDGFIVEIVNPNAASITLARNGWLIAGSAANATFTAARRRYHYRADLGDWKLAADLGLDDDLPYPAQFDGYFRLELGDAICPGYARELSAADRKRLDDGRTKLYAQYCAPPPTQFDAEAQTIGVANRGGAGGSLNDFLNGNI